jgi:hypothetical protein
MGDHGKRTSEFWRHPTPRWSMSTHNKPNKKITPVDPIDDEATRGLGDGGARIVSPFDHLRASRTGTRLRQRARQRLSIGTASAISQIEIGFHALGSSTPWTPRFQIDSVGWKN